MKRLEMEEKFLDYLEGTLSPDEVREFEQALKEDGALRDSFNAYNKVVNAERSIAQTEHTLSANFDVKVMQQIEDSEVGFFRRMFMEIAENQKRVFGAVATLATVMLVIALSSRSPELMRAPAEMGQSMEANRPLQEGLQDAAIPAKKVEAPKDIGPVIAKEVTELKAQPPAPPIEKREDAAKRQLPADKTGITIKVDQTSSVEGYSPPGTDVDVVMTTKENGAITSRVVSEKAKIVAMGNGQVKLEVAPAQASVLAKAAEAGTLGLMMRSQADTKGVDTNLTADYMALEQERAPIIAKQKADSRRITTATAPMPIAPPYQGPASGGRSGEALKRAEPLTGASPFADALSETATYQNADPARLNTESYNSYEENARTPVTENPLSTFSIDVDTGSYTNARRFLSAGNLPPKDSIRIEEFINYFDYSYPVQHEKPFTLSYEIAPSPLEKERYLLKLGIKARDAVQENKPWNLVFLVDVSGSMLDENKLPLVKKSLKILVDKMRPEDKIAIVTYAGNAGVVLSSTTVREKERILNAIDSLGAGGSTNGSGGINLAYDMAIRNKINGAVNRVVLATDGDFNVGVTSQDALIRLIEEKRKAGITLTTLGFGSGNIQEGTMEQLANKGNGNYFYIDSLKEARKVLDTDLFGTMEVVAKDVKLQIEFNPQHVAEYRLIGYENRKLRREDFNNDKIDAGEIGTGHTVTALYEVLLTKSELAKTLSTELRYQKEQKEAAPKAGAKELSPELAFLKIRYKQPDGDKSSLLEYPIEAAQVKDDSAATSNDFRFAAAVSYFGHLLRGSEFSGDYTFKDIATLAQGARGEDKNGYRQEFIELVKNAGSMSR